MADQDLPTGGSRQRISGAKALALGFRSQLVVAGAALALAMVITAGENSIYRYARAVLQLPEATKVSIPAVCGRHDECSGSKQDKPMVVCRQTRESRSTSPGAAPE